MNSSRNINYELRPAKFVERKMMLASLVNICSHYNSGFQYIGFGGVSFTDFKLFHKELHINEMISIEGGDLISKERIKFNSPYSFIELKFGLSNQVLPRLDLSKKSILWLDYDYSLDITIFNDIEIALKKLPKGSIYIITCNRELKDRNTGKEYEKEAFKEVFGDLVPFDLKNKDFTGEENFKTIRKMLLSHIANVLNGRQALDEYYEFHQLFNFLYQENRGAKMFTFGGLVEESSFDIKKLNLSSFEFISTNESPHRVRIPQLTRKEIDLINSNFDNVDDINSKIIEPNQLEKYKSSYKYLPNYLDVRL